MVIYIAERETRIYPFSEPQGANESDDALHLRLAGLGSVSVLRKGYAEDIGSISCNFAVSHKAVTPGDFAEWANKLDAAFKAAIKISEQLRSGND